MEFEKKLKITKKEWDKEIKEASQTWEFAEANKNQGDIFYCHENKERAIVLIKKKGIKLFSRAQIFTNSDNKEFILKILKKIKERRVPYARIGNTMFGTKEILNIQNCKKIVRNTFVLDLGKKELDLWNSFNKKLRNAIRKAQKEKVIFEELKKEELKDYYKLSLETENRIKNVKGKKTFNLQDFEFFKEVFENKLGRFFIAKHKQKIIAGALFLVFNKKSVYFQSFSLREFSSLQAPSLIQWAAIKQLKKEGIQEFDLGGVTLGLDEGDSRYFVYEFKRKFNGSLQEFYNFEIDLNKTKRKIQDLIIKAIYK